MEIKVVRKVLDVNDTMAARNRELFRSKNVFVLNMMSSPGSGKTTTLEKTLALLAPDVRCAVIVGDVCTTNDADRLARAGVFTDVEFRRADEVAHVFDDQQVRLIQIQVHGRFFDDMRRQVAVAAKGVGVDLNHRHARAVVLSVTEGEDKPLKYPLMFRVCDAALLNKTDLLPHLDYDKAAALENIRQIHPEMPIFEMSARTGEGLAPWVEWLKDQVKRKIR